MTVRLLHSVARPFEIYRELDSHSFELTQKFRDNVLDEMTLLNSEEALPTFFMPDYDITDTRLKRIELASNNHIIADNYEKYVRGSPKALGKALQFCLNEVVDYANIDVRPTATFATQYGDRLRFGVTFDNDEILAQAATRAQKTLRRWCRAEVSDTPPYMYIGSVSYSGIPEHTKKILDAARESRFEEFAHTVLGLGPVMFAGELFEANETDFDGPYNR